MSSRRAIRSVGALQNVRLGLTSVCPTCAFAWAVTSTLATQPRPTTLPSNLLPRRAKRRHASTLASSTAINAAKEIPPALRDLHASLERLKRDAPNYLNLSRVQLALRSLESKNPTIRVAVLGLQSQETSRRLSRLLLADALGDQGQWEKQLESFAEDDSRALLLRYGDEADPVPSNSQVMTLHVPSRILQRHNLEILVSSLNVSSETPAGNADARELRRAALVPTAEAPSSFAGGVSFLTYPVHRAIILGDGLKGCMSLGRYVTQEPAGDDEANFTVQLASNFPELAKSTDRDGLHGEAMSILDVSSAEEAIASLRESVSNASIYEKKWNESGVSQISQWLSKGFDSNENGLLDPAVGALVDDLVAEVSTNLRKEYDERSERLVRSVVSDDARQPLDESLRIWAMRAHLELRDQLDAAFTSEKWSKLRWWKLFWRVDDVSMITTELVERSWLVQAEKAIIWLSGRSAEAGLHDGPHSLRLKPPPGDRSDESQTTDSNTKVSSAQTSAPTPIDPRLPSGLPWPIQIPLARRGFQTATIPALQSLSQALLLQTFTVTTLTTALSALVYVSFPASTLYSSAAIAALGVAWSLRRMQRTWEAARSSWEGEARERGRVVLKDVEENFRQMIKANVPKAQALDAVDLQDSKMAKEAVEQVKRALGEVSEAQRH